MTHGLQLGALLAARWWGRPYWGWCCRSRSLAWNVRCVVKRDGEVSNTGNIFVSVKYVWCVFLIVAWCAAPQAIKVCNMYTVYNINIFVFCALFSWTLRTAGTENAAVINRSHSQVWREILQVHACPSWLRPGGSLGHLKARTRGHGTMQIFQPELLESIFGAKPPKRRHPEISCHDPTFSKRFQAGSVPRDSMRATKLSRGKAAMGGFQRRRSPRPFREGWNLASARFPRVTAAVAKCVVFTKRNGVSKLLTLWMGGESKSNKKH